MNDALTPDARSDDFETETSVLEDAVTTALNIINLSTREDVYEVALDDITTGEVSLGSTWVPVAGGPSVTVIQLIPLFEVRVTDPAEGSRTMFIADLREGYRPVPEAETEGQVPEGEAFAVYLDALPGDEGDPYIQMLYRGNMHPWAREIDTTELDELIDKLIALRTTLTPAPAAAH